QPKSNCAGLLRTFDDHGFAAHAAIGACSADDRRDLVWRRRVEELDRDLTTREKECDVTGCLRRCEARESADTGVVSHLPALRIKQRVGQDPLVADAWAFFTEIQFDVVERHSELDRLRGTATRARL